MHRYLAVLACAVGLAGAPGSAFAQKAQKQQPFFPYPMKVDKLDNGLSVVRVPFNSPGLISYNTVVRIGSRNEVEEGHTGFAHFFEHMMFKGTKNNPEGTRENLIGKYGFNDNAFTTNDVTLYHSFGPSEALEQLVDIEADRFKNLEYSEAAFQTEAKAVLGEYHKSAANPVRRLDEKLRETAYTTHTYRHTTLGYYEDIKKMPGYYEYSRQFFERWYTPDNVMIFVVGDFDDAKLMQWVRAAYGDWKGKSAQVTIPVEPVQRQEKVAHMNWDSPTLPRHLVAWHTPGTVVGRIDGPIQHVLGAYLAGPTSPLYKRLVLEQQLVESITAGPDLQRDPQLFSVYAVLKDEKHRDAVRDAINKTVRELVTGKIDGKRLDAVKGNLRYGLLMGLESADDVGTQLGYLAGVMGTPDALNQYYQSMSQVTPAQLQTFAKEYLTARNRTTITLTHKPAAQAQSSEAK